MFSLHRNPRTPSSYHQGRAWLFRDVRTSFCTLPLIISIFSALMLTRFSHSSLSRAWASSSGVPCAMANNSASAGSWMSCRTATTVFVSTVGISCVMATASASVAAGASCSASTAVSVSIISRAFSERSGFRTSSPPPGAGTADFPSVPCSSFGLSEIRSSSLLAALVVTWADVGTLLVGATDDGANEVCYMGEGKGRGGGLWTKTDSGSQDCHAHSNAHGTMRSWRRSKLD